MYTLFLAIALEKNTGRKWYTSRRAITGVFYSGKFLHSISLHSNGHFEGTSGIFLRDQVKGQIDIFICISQWRIAWIKWRNKNLQITNSWYYFSSLSRKGIFVPEFFSTFPIIILVKWFSRLHSTFACLLACIPFKTKVLYCLSIYLSYNTR